MCRKIGVDKRCCARIERKETSDEKRQLRWQRSTSVFRGLIFLLLQVSVFLTRLKLLEIEGTCNFNHSCRRPHAHTLESECKFCFIIHFKHLSHVKPQPYSTKTTKKNH